MTYVPLLLSLLAVDLLAAMSPGPNFVLVTQSAVHRTRRHALAVVCGLVVANLIWCIAVVLGLATLFGLVPWLYGAIKILGGAYLVWLGVQLFGVRRLDAALSVESRESGGEGKRPPHSKAFIRGVITNLANPKSAVYFGSIFALFMKPGTPGWVQGAAVAIVLADTFLWYGSVALVLSTTAAQRWYRRARRTIDRVAGTLMIAFGARLVFSRS